MPDDSMPDDSMPDDGTVDAIDALFDLPVADFITSRDTLVRTLRDQGEPNAALRVKALRRPTLAAWAVNQVVRATPAVYDDLVAAGNETQRAQRRALSGVRDNGLRDAAAVRRAMVGRLTDAAADILTAAGVRPASHLDDVAATFEAASADPAVAGHVGVAQLSAPIRLVADFSGAGALASVPDTSGPGAPDDDHGDRAEDARAVQRRAAMRVLEVAYAKAQTAAAEARRTRAEAKDADRHAEDARVRATTARAAAADADADSADADEAAELARASARKAASLAQTMADLVDNATRELADLAER